jgi:CDP-paratose 2-epimerase
VNILITGGAGFVGSALAKYFRRNAAKNSVVVVDNLRRRGSEWNVDGLRSEGVTFVHGDIRNPTDLEAIAGTFDVLIEASAEASVHAGIADSPRYVLDTNLVGALNCLEFARKRCGGFVFLSSSRVYSIEPLAQLPVVKCSSRFELRDGDCKIPGVSRDGVTECFPCNTHRSYYGASKLAAELVCQEYASHAGLPIVINRCGVIAGPGQFGRTDQGVFTLWVARHHFGRPLKYTGFGGQGLQVRDLLHPNDLCDLVGRQLQSWNLVSGRTFNVGGGRSGSVSLQEFTWLCQETTGRKVTITEDLATSPVDIPWYVTDNAQVTTLLDWTPLRPPKQIVADITKWIRANESNLARILV